MGKVPRNFMIDEELEERLRSEPNRSKLVNDLLKNYYDNNLDMSLEKLQQELKVTNDALEEAKDRAEKIKKQITIKEKHRTKYGGLKVRITDNN